MIEYLNHNFIPVIKEDLINQWLYVYCTNCNIGALYDSNFERKIRTMHFSKKLPDGSLVFETSMRQESFLTCEEYQIKKLLE